MRHSHSTPSDSHGAEQIYVYAPHNIDVYMNLVTVNHLKKWIKFGVNSVLTPDLTPNYVK